MLEPHKSGDNRVVPFPAAIALDELFQSDTAQRLLAQAQSVDGAKAVRDRAEAVRYS